MAFSLQQPRDNTKCLPPSSLDTSEPPASPSLATMSNSNSSSHARWQGTKRWKQGHNAAWKEWDDSTTSRTR